MCCWVTWAGNSNFATEVSLRLSPSGAPNIKRLPSNATWIARSSVQRPLGHLAVNFTHWIDSISIEKHSGPMFLCCLRGKNQFFKLVIAKLWNLVACNTWWISDMGVLVSFIHSFIHSFILSFGNDVFCATKSTSGWLE